MSTTRSSSQNSGSGMPSWCTIESDPGVFTELISQMGVKDTQVEEIYMLDKSLLQGLKPIYGLIFLFKWRPGEKDDGPIVENEKLFFANQVINNACATQAILSILLNSPEIDIGIELGEFKEFTKDFPPDIKGLAVSNCEPVRIAHNSFARPEPVVMGEKHSEEDNDVFHFISYIPFDGGIYELDGLKQGPIFLGECGPSEDWLDKVFPIIQQRIDRYARSEIRFNLLAVIRDRRTFIKEQISSLEKQKTPIMDRINELKTSGINVPLDIVSHLPSDLSELSARVEAIDGEIDSLRHKLEQEQEKFRQWKMENIRRRHNYVPFFVNLLKILAEKGQLAPLIQMAQQRKV